MNNKRCTHIIIRDKFTSGYIDFFRQFKMGYNHTFFTFDGEYNLDVRKDKDLIIVNNYSAIVSDYKHILEKSDKVVLAAFFDDAFQLLKLPQKIWDKIYIQFWGGDIYRFKNKKSNLIPKTKQEIARQLVKISIKKAAGVLTLVEGDYNSIESIFNLKNVKHQVAQVPDDFYTINHLDYKTISEKQNEHHKKRILVGNSATIENNHLEIFDLLKNKIDQSYEVLVPLSYGDKEYQKEIIEKGRGMLKDSFVPILDFMDRERYIGLLSTCDVAIFNNNRQQATGNIILLANLGKKLYLRDDTSMWSFFKDLNFKLHKISDLVKEDICSLISYSEKERSQNYQALREMEEEAIEQWRNFFHD